MLRFITIYLLIFVGNCVNPLPLMSDRETQQLSQEKTREVQSTTPGSALIFYEIDDMMFLSADRSGQMGQAYRWPKGRIPYAFAPGYSYFEMSEIRLAMYYIEEYTCIKFHNRLNSDKNYIYIRRVKGKCSSFVGNIRQGAQQVSLDPGARKCSRPNFPGHVLHELTHAIGFFHEHARDDRDSYVDIRYENLPSDERTRKNYNRNIDNRIESNDFGVPYNYGSIMHYSGRAGSVNGKETIVRKKKRPNGLPQPFEGTMGQREKLSHGDIKMIQTMYKHECSGSVDFDDIPDDDDIPDLDDWMEDRKLSGTTMSESEMNVEEVTQDTVGIINEIPQDNQIPTPDNPDYSIDEISTSGSDPHPSTTTESILNSTNTITSQSKASPTTTTTTTPRPRTTTKRKRRTTRRITTTTHRTTQVPTKTPNLYNLIQYVIHQFSQQQQQSSG